MTKQLCPCSELDWRDIDYSLEHHPLCAEPAREFGRLIEEGVDAAKRACQKYVEIYSQAKPTTEFNAAVNCRLCGLHYEVKLEVPHGSKSVRWSCPQCEHKTCVWFNEQDAIDDLEASLQDYHVTPESIATMSLSESNGVFILCPKCGNSNSFDPDARLGDCHCPKCGAAPYKVAPGP